MDTNANPARHVLNNTKLSRKNGFNMYLSIVVAIVGKNNAPTTNRKDDIRVKLLFDSDSTIVSFVIDFLCFGKQGSE